MKIKKWDTLVLADADAQLVEAVGHDEAHGGEVIGRAEAADGKVALRGRGSQWRLGLLWVFGEGRRGEGKGKGRWFGLFERCCLLYIEWLRSLRRGASLEPLGRGIGWFCNSGGSGKKLKALLTKNARNVGT